MVWPVAYLLASGVVCQVAVALVSGPAVLRAKLVLLRLLAQKFCVPTCSGHGLRPSGPACKITAAIVSGPTGLAVNFPE